MEDKFKNLDPYGNNQDIASTGLKELAGLSEKSIKTFTKKEKLEDYKDFSPSAYKPFLKTNKKMNFITP